LARSTDTGEAALLSLIRTKFIVEPVQKLPNLGAASLAFKALGPDEFRGAVVLLDDVKSRALLKKLDKHFPSLTEIDLAGAQNAIVELAAGTRAPSPAPAAKRRGATPAAVAPLPDVRVLYRSGGIDALNAGISALKLPALKTLIEVQSLSATISKGRSADEHRKFIQIAVRDELGRRGDAIGTIAGMRDDAE
jgi:hypothetical protein